MKIVICLFLMSMMLNAFAQKNIKYEYKKHEKFDFSALDIEGGQSSPGDLSIAPRFRKEFKNRIPERKEFHKEMKRALDAVR